MGIAIASAKSLLVSSSAESELHLGNVIWDENGVKYIKCRNVSAGDLTDKHVLCVDQTTPFTTERGFTVLGVRAGTASQDSNIYVGFNQTGGVISDDDYFWAQASGAMTALGGTTGDIGAGVAIYSSATTGEVDDDPSAATRSLGFTTAARTGVGSVTVWIYTP